jgi:hypothetical protein
MILVTWMVLTIIGIFWSGYFYEGFGVAVALSVALLLALPCIYYDQKLD